MAETAVPALGSDQQEKPQVARSEQNPTPASASSSKDAEVPRGTETPKDKIAGPGEGKTWKRPENVGRAATVASVLVLTVALSIYERMKPSGNGPGRKPAAEAKHHETDPRAETERRLMQLQRYRSVAEEALVLAMFYKDEEKGEERARKLKRCRDAVRTWREETIKESGGEPRWPQADGLVISLGSGVAMEKDFWERATAAERWLSQELGESTIDSTGTGIAPASKGK
jgi:hypothetical protein